MAVTLIRASDGIGLIQNSDDARIMRYAVNGRDGIVKSYGNELAVKFEDHYCIIQSGEFVINGWQVIVSGIGESIPMQVNGTYYYKIYIEIDLRVTNNQTASIKSTYSLIKEDNPILEHGDDLTENANGVSRRLIHYVKVENGVGTLLKSADKLEYNYASVPYVDEQIRAVKNINSDNVIFGESVVGISRRQVNFVSINIDTKLEMNEEVIQMGLYGLTGIYSALFTYTNTETYKINEKYRPKKLIITGGTLIGTYTYKDTDDIIHEMEEELEGGVRCKVNENGNITVSAFTYQTGFVSQNNDQTKGKHFSKFRLIANIGYEITE